MPLFLHWIILVVFGLNTLLSYFLVYRRAKQDSISMFIISVFDSIVYTCLTVAVFWYLVARHYQ